MQELIPYDPMGSNGGGNGGGRVSPFDAIKRVDADGEHWSGRELMPFLDYGRWERFEDAIQRAMIAVKNCGADPDSQFRASAKITPNSRGQRREVADYRLTRYAAYLLAMNADPRKPAVASAQTYFAVKTREAETGMHTKELDELEVAERYVATLKANRELQVVVAKQSKELDSARNQVAYVNTFVDPGCDNTLFRTFCGQINAPERKLREHLQAKGIIYKKFAGREWSKSEKRWKSVHEWHAHAAYKAWFHKTDQPDAPRLHNNQMRTTLYVTPVGKVAIDKWLERNPIEGAK